MFYLGVTDDGDIDFDEEEFDSLEIPSELEGWKYNDPQNKKLPKKDLGIIFVPWNKSQPIPQNTLSNLTHLFIFFLFFNI